MVVIILRLKATRTRVSGYCRRIFEITQKEARKYNGKAVELPQSNWWLYVIIGVMVLLILFLLFLLWRKNKQDKTEE
ncbi:LPXTG cell wall anchor domain-containing protein [Latilactobacillus sakei]|uniref:LPXTG cell wall anchor domain-containing protein n=1 Tax=Latilactobacillus sakei TaxID=1599 RepID=UPI003AF1C311|nr:LPXTG cell wall anchor domain-containing protein [Latilactobacillus sakei]UNC24156.1 LPXTG cell wall anchor domain-containing protein [Latilactobacillus sakei]